MLPRHTWQYWRPGGADVVELGLVHGTEVALPDHFHDEDQVTFVIAGQRRFLFGKRLVAVEAGEGLCIPAGTPHRSQPQPLGVVCINLYVRAAVRDTALLLERLRETWRLRTPFPLDALADLARERHPHPFRPGAGDSPLLSRSAPSVQAAAREFAMSREGYSRAFRRAYGMPPKAFGVMSRLNEARALLRSGVPLADTAAISGFADQSHLGRCFRRAFGVTPGRYRGR